MGKVLRGQGGTSQKKAKSPWNKAQLLRMFINPPSWTLTVQETKGKCQFPPVGCMEENALCVREVFD